MTMFGKSSNSYLSKAISIRSPRDARESVAKLNALFRESKTRDKKIRIARAASLASNRAKMQLRRSNLSSKERGEMREVSRIYRVAAERYFKAAK